MDDLQLLADFHLRGDRQGPGGADETRRAIDLAGLRGRTDLRIADVGCGTRASTLVLAGELDARIVAVDFLEVFLARLTSAAEAAGLDDRITTSAASMDALPFDDASLDAIWAEGAIYNIGFEDGVRAWRRFLAPGGVLAVSELTWLTAERPAELTDHWAEAYPEVETAAAKMAVLERHGYTPIGYFPLDEHCWLDHYYDPIRNRIDAFLADHGQSAAAEALVAAELEEIDLYERFRAFVSYGFYVARRVDD